MNEMGSDRSKLRADICQSRKHRVINLGGVSFDLAHTLMSGQTFRWRRERNGFIGVVGKNVLRLQQDGRRLLYDSIPEQIALSELRAYLGLDEESEKALRSLPRDQFLRRAMRKFHGMRILRQEPWETLISFIISANNNIIRIKRCIESLCQRFGEEIGGNEKASRKRPCGKGNPPVASGETPRGAFADAPSQRETSVGQPAESEPGIPPQGEPPLVWRRFPTAEALAEASLGCFREECNLGYRDAYVKETARIIAGSPSLLSDIARLPYPRARKEIMELPGVGPKVADCALLYSMGKFEAFPVDTWIARVVKEHYSRYFRGKKVSPNAIRAFAHNHFGPSAGYAQLYLFQYAMTGDV